MPRVVPLGVILAAGGSTRMRSPKALLRLRDQPLVLAHLERIAPWVEASVVVVGAHEAEIGVVVGDRARIVVNPSWATTHPVDSLRIALSERPASALVLPVDTMPPLAATLAALVEAGAPAVPVGPHGEEGHPVLLDAAAIRWVLDEPAPVGLRGILSGAPRVSVRDPLVHYDFDDPDAFAFASGAVGDRTRGLRPSGG